MELQELKDEVKKIQIELIKRVINNESEEEDIPYARPRDMETLIGEIIGENVSVYDFDINGWQWDYWAYIRVNDETYSIGGDGYYGDSCRFSKKND